MPSARHADRGKGLDQHALRTIEVAVFAGEPGPAEFREAIVNAYREGYERPVVRRLHGARQTRFRRRVQLALAYT